MVNYRKKLLVLDINGLLLDTYYQGESRPDRPHDAKVNRFYVYKRASCDDFIQFCLQNFTVGVWSSAREHNVHSLVDFMFKDAKGDLAFIWHQQHCTDTGFRHPDNKYKPVFLKELSKLWENHEADLPWARGDYGPSNTLLIDDSPYKAIGNPRNTAIFPKTYNAADPEDKYLGELLPYLEGLLKARDVQKYVHRNPIGEPSISPSDPQWSQVLKSGQLRNDEELPIPAHLMGRNVPVRINPVLPSDDWMRPDSLLPANGLTGPLLMGAESQGWNTAHGDRRWRRQDRNPQSNWDRVGNPYDPPYDPQGFKRDYFERDAGPSRPMNNDTSHDLIRKHAMLSAGRSSDYGDISRGDWRYNEFHSHSRSDVRRSSFGEYESRASGWSDEPEEFSRGEPWDFNRIGARDQEGSYQGEGKRKRRIDWNKEPRGVRTDENRVIRSRNRSRERSFEDPRSFQRRTSPRHDQRWEESQFKSKSREGRDSQRYTDKEQSRKRDLSEDSGRRLEKYDQSNDWSQPSNRRKIGRKD